MIESFVDFEGENPLWVNFEDDTFDDDEGLLHIIRDDEFVLMLLLLLLLLALARFFRGGLSVSACLGSPRLSGSLSSSATM